MKYWLNKVALKFEAGIVVDLAASQISIVSVFI